MRKALLFLVGLTTSSHAQIGPLPTNCGPSLSDSKKAELVRYVTKRYKLPSTVTLEFAKDEAVSGTCYRELAFQGTTSLKTWRLTLYLSPDHRFLSSEMFDTSLDPAEEERRKAQAFMTGLVQNKGSSRGPDKAPVTIVEFSDFQCPYCRKLAETMDEVLPGEKDQVRVVFHHMPLSMHPWARTAAEGAACAQLQSHDAFWAMHDQLFRHQQDVTVDNVKQKMTIFAKEIKGLDAASFQTCLENQMSLGLVFRDINLASANEVNATPTLFINGHRVAGVKDADDLRRLIAEAAAEARPEDAHTHRVADVETPSSVRP